MAWQHCLDSTTQQILQATTAEFVGKATSIDEQLPTLYQEQEKLADQISVMESCIEDYSANRLQGHLEGLSFGISTSRAKTKGLDPISYFFWGEWKVGKTYGENIPPAATFWEFVQVTDEESPFGYVYYYANTLHTSSGTTKPPSSVWTPLDITSYPFMTTVVNLGIGFNQKTYGNQIRNWQIVDSTALTYILYEYEGGAAWGIVPELDDQVIELVGNWDGTNDLVTRPFLEDAFYGLKAKYDNVGKAIDYLQNTKNKYIAMVPLLGKFIK